MHQYMSANAQQDEEENSPDEALECPYNLGGKTAIPGSVHDAQEHPRNISSKCADETNTPDQDTIPSGHLDLPKELRAIEVDWSHGNIVNGGELDGIGCGHNGNSNNINIYVPD